MSINNNVRLIGNLGREPELRFTSTGIPVVNVSIATNDVYKDKTTGEKKTATEWHNLVFYRKAAEIIKEHAKEGSGIIVEGHLHTRSWKDTDGGKDRYRTEIIVDQFRFMPKGKSSDQDPGELAEQDTGDIGEQDMDPPLPEMPDGEPF